MLIFLTNTTTAVVVSNSMVYHRIDQTIHRMGSNELLPPKQAQEEILHHILCFVSISNSHRDEIDYFIAMLGIIVDDKFVIVHAVTQIMLTHSQPF